MKFTPREIIDDIGVTPGSQFRDFFVLLGGILGILLAVYVLLGFAVDIAVSRLPPEIEEKMGSFFAESYGEAEGTPVEERLRGILGRLADADGIGADRYHLHLVNDPTVNAFALPGGTIVVFSGLVRQAESENELAFVLAHELGHFAGRDHLKGLGRTLVLLVMSSAVFGTDSSISEFLTRSLTTAEMRFSQRQESRADLWAADLLYKSYGDAGGGLDFLEKMAREDNRSRFRYFFATHPYPKDRVKNMEAHVIEKGYPINGRIPLDEVLRNLPSTDEESQTDTGNPGES